VLRAARRDRGWSLEQLSCRTRIQVERLAEIEHGQIGNCGAAVYARGHIRAIAAALQLDPQPLIDALAAYDPPVPPLLTALRKHLPADVPTAAEVAPTAPVPSLPR
jgi:cytoskeletal protein RodZ